jgi:formate/nitrite transporter FocA (FNT family)
MTSPSSGAEPPPKSHTSDPKEEEKKPKLDQLEENKARQEESLDQKITYDVIRREGDKELERPLSGLWWAAVAGGMSMGFIFMTEALLRSHLPDAEWRPLITKLGYPVGFLIITLGSQQLFTENTVTPIVPLMISYTAEKMRKMVALQAVVLLGNILGALLFAAALGWTDVFEPKVHTAFTEIGAEALRHSFLTTFASGIFAGWLIALMVWMLPAASANQVSTISIITYLVGLGGLAHVIVGSVEVLYLVVTGQASIGTYIGSFFIPSLIGNVIGGFVLVTWLNHAQVTSGDGHRK